MTPAEIQELVELIPLPAGVMVGLRLVAANAKMAELTGYSRQQLIEAEAPLMFTAESQQAQVIARREARLRGEPVPSEFDYQGRAANGAIISARVRISQFPAAGPSAHLFLITDERIREQAADLIRGLVDVAVAAQQEQTQADFFRVLQEGLLNLGLTSTVLDLGRDQDLSAAEGTLIQDFPAFLASIGESAATPAAGVPDRAVVAVIRVAGAPRYAICCSGDRLDSAVAGAVGLLGRQLSAALETTRKIEEQDRRNAQLSLLLELGREVMGALEVDEVLESGARIAARSLRCSCAYVFLPNESGTALRVAAREEPDPEVDARLGTEFPLDQEWLSGAAFKTQLAQFSTNTAADLRVAPEIVRRFRCTSTLAVPLLSHGRALGVLSLFERTSRTFDLLDARLATHAAQLISSTLENARLYADLRRSYAELERTQKELIDRERLAALGALSASIAHEVRNPLGVIFNSVGSLRRLLKPQGDDVALLLDIVGEEADRLNRMVGDLLDYSRPVRPALEPAPLRPLIEDAVAAARQQLGPSSDAVKVEIQIAPEAATVRADARLLRQALVNLFLNAHQAMPHGGLLDVRASRRGEDGAARAEIAIRDSGPGIPAASREKIFQPFFTTKAMGTGLGLAVAKRIIEGHGGTLALADAASGAEFQLLLPIEG